jgi:hypothetical protein
MSWVQVLWDQLITTPSIGELTPYSGEFGSTFFELEYDAVDYYAI